MARTCKRWGNWESFENGSYRYSRNAGVLETHLGHQRVQLIAFLQAVVGLPDDPIGKSALTLRVVRFATHRYVSWTAKRRHCAFRNA